MSAETQPALKEMFNAARYRRIAALLADVHPGFDRKRFLALTTKGRDELSLLQRMRRTTEACRATLPEDFPTAVSILKRLAPQLKHGFVCIFLPDFVGQYGHDHFEASMTALKYFTSFGSSEFAIREFLKRDLTRTLGVMETWSRDADEHVRRLASEGCRPRLPWSFHLTELIADPSPVVPILENLRADSSLYVRKSVANHLNDISKDHPDWMLDRLAAWDLTNPDTRWIAKRAARRLIKDGHPRSFRLFGFTEKIAVKLSRFSLAPSKLKLGGGLNLSFHLQSTADQPQKLAVDYIVHYRKKSGKSAPKVFKLKEVTLAPRAGLVLKKRQRMTDFTTRIHHPGRHEIEIMVNGTVMAGRSFELTR